MRRFFVLLAVLSLLVSNLSVKSQNARFEFGFGILKNPSRIACHNGLIYVCDTGLKSVLCFDSEWNLAAKTADGLFESPVGIAVSDDGQVYVCDNKKKTVTRLGRWLANPRPVELPTEVILKEPFDLCIDSSSTLNILDREARTVQLVGLSGRYLGSFCAAGIGENQLAWPQSIDRYGQSVAISDAGVGKVIVFDRKHQEKQRFGIPGNWPQSVRFPSDLHVDKNGNLYVLDSELSDVAVYPFMGINPIIWGRYGRRDKPTDFFFSDLARNNSATDARGCMNHPLSIASDNENVYVADTGNARILVESIDTVLEQPRLSPLPFAGQVEDYPQIAASPSTLDFGSVAKDRAYVRTLRVDFLTHPCQVAKVSVTGNFFDVEPKLVVGSHATLYIRHKPKSNGVNNANLTIELPGARLDISITASCDGGDGLRFSDQSARSLTVAGDSASGSVTIERGKGLSESISLVASKIVFKPPWAKVARGSEEVSLSTLSMNITPDRLDQNTTQATVTAMPVGVLRPGVYSVRLAATTESGKYKTYFDLTIFVSTGQYPQSTVLLETFTAHWCEPCGYQREAGYRMFSEYSGRAIIPVAYHVMDDADFAITGLTRPENFEQFKKYGAEGVPLNVYDGDPAKPVSNGKQLAHDRIRGRKYSGSTGEYWKMRGDFDQEFRRAKYQLNVAGTITGSTGSVYVEIPGCNLENQTENELIILLTEDDIEYNSSNGEQYHHFVVRIIASRYKKTEETSGSALRMTFDIPKMPEGFEINPLKARFVAFLQNRKTQKVASAGWCDIDSMKESEPVVFIDSKSSPIQPNSLIPVKVDISNTSMFWKRFRLSALTNSSATANPLADEEYIGANSAKTIIFNVDTSSIQALPANLIMSVFLEDESGKKYQYDLDFSTGANR